MKRQKFLERNRLGAHTHTHTHTCTHFSALCCTRAAASRCRAKKKLWVEDMERKTKDMDSLNQALQQEVASLRSEVQQLKSILIAHKDCPLIVHQTVGGPPAGELIEGSYSNYCLWGEPGTGLRLVFL